MGAARVCVVLQYTLGLLLFSTGWVLTTDATQSEELAQALSDPIQKEKLSARAEAKLEAEAAREIRQVENKASAQIRDINQFVACARKEQGAKGCDQLMGGRFKETGEKAQKRLQERAARELRQKETDATELARVKAGAAASEQGAHNEVLKLKEQLAEASSKVKGLVQDVQNDRGRIRQDKITIDKLLRKSRIADKLRTDTENSAAMDKQASEREMQLLRDRMAVHAGKITAAEGENRALKDKNGQLESELLADKRKEKLLVGKMQHLQHVVDVDDHQLGTEKRTAQHYAQEYELEQQRRRQEQDSAMQASREHDEMLQDMMEDCNKAARRVADKRAKDASLDAESKGLIEAMIQDAAQQAYKSAYNSEVQSCAAEAKEAADRTAAKARKEAQLQARADKVCKRATSLEEEAATAEASAIKAGSDAAALQSQCNFNQEQPGRRSSSTRTLLKMATKTLTMSENLPGTISVGEATSAVQRNGKDAAKVCRQASTAASLARTSNRAAKSAQILAHEAKEECNSLQAQAKLAAAQKALEQAKARAQQLGRLCKLKKSEVTNLIKEVELPSNNGEARGRLLAELEDAKESAQSICAKAEQAAATASMKAAEATAASLASASAGETSPEAMKALAAAKAKKCAASKLKVSEIKAKYGPQAQITKDEQKRSGKICAEAAAASAAANAAVAAFSAAQANGIADETQLSLEAAAAKAKAQAADAAAAARLKLLCDKSKAKVRRLRQKLFATPTADKPKLAANIKESEKKSAATCAQAAAAAHFAEKLRQAALAAGSGGQHAAELKKLCESSRIKLQQLQAKGKSDPSVHATLPQVEEETDKVCSAARRAAESAAAATAARECRRLELKVSTLEEQGSPEIPLYEKKAKLACAAAAAAAAAANSAKLEATCSESKKSVVALRKIQPSPEELPSVIDRSKRACAKAEAARARSTCLSKEHKVKALLFSKSERRNIQAARLQADEACAKSAAAEAAAQSAGVTFEQERLAALCEATKKELLQLKQDPSADVASIGHAENRMKDICAAAHAHAKKSKAIKEAEAKAASRAEAEAARLAAKAAKLAAACKVATEDLAQFESKIGVEGLNNPSLQEDFNTKKDHKKSTCQAAAAAMAAAAAAKVTAAAKQQSCSAAAAGAATKFDNLREQCQKLTERVDNYKTQLHASKLEEKEDLQKDLRRTDRERKAVCRQVPEAQTRSEALANAKKTAQSLAACLAAADAAEAARLATLCKQHKSEASALLTQLKVAQTTDRKESLQHDFTAAKTRADASCHAASKAAAKAAASKSQAARGIATEAHARAAAAAKECEESKARTKALQTKLVAAAAEAKDKLEAAIKKSREESETLCTKAASHATAYRKHLSAQGKGSTPKTLSEMEHAKLLALCSQAKANAQTAKTDFTRAVGPDKSHFGERWRQAEKEAMKTCQMAAAAASGKNRQALLNLQNEAGKLEKECLESTDVHLNLQQRLATSPGNTSLAEETQLAQQSKDEICKAARAARAAAAAAHANHDAAFEKTLHSKKERVPLLCENHPKWIRTCDLRPDLCHHGDPHVQQAYRDHCPRTCGVCGDDPHGMRNVSLPTITKRRKADCFDTPGVICRPKKALCTHSVERFKMEKDCPNTCGLCVEYVSDAKCPDLPGYERVCPLTQHRCLDKTIIGEEFRRQCPGTCNACPTNSTKELCENMPKYDSTCHLRADFCHSNDPHIRQAYREHCPRTCGLCGGHAPPVSVPKPADTMAPDPNCTDHMGPGQCNSLKYNCVSQDPNVQKRFHEDCPMTCGMCKPVPGADFNQEESKRIKTEQLELDKEKARQEAAPGVQMKKILAKRLAKMKHKLQQQQRNLAAHKVNTSDYSPPVNQYKAQLDAAIKETAQARTDRQRQLALEKIADVRKKEELASERDSRVGAISLEIAKVTVRESKKCELAKAKAKSMIADANEDGTISSPAMKRQIELVLKDSDTTCANATRFAKEQQTASNAGDAFDSVSRRVTARCIEAQKDVADFQATGSFNATMEGIQIATNQLKERTKLFCDRASGLGKAADAAGVSTQSQQGNKATDDQGTLISQMKAEEREADAERAHAEKQMNDIKAKLDFAPSPAVKDRMKRQLKVEQQVLKAATDRANEVRLERMKIQKQKQLHKQLQAQNAANAVDKAIGLSQAQKVASSMAAKANDASTAAQAQEDDATAAQENVVNSLQKAYSEAEDAEKANRAADEAKREAHEASNLAQIAQNANTTANSHKLFQHVNSAIDKVARKASEARVENERLKKQETLVTEDMSRMQSLNQSLSVPGMSNSSDKQFLVQQIQEANATLSADQTKLKTLKSNAATAQQVVRDAEQALTAARAKANGDLSISEHALRAQESVKDAQAHLAVAQARAEAAKTSAGENKKAKEKLLQLVDRNVARAEDRARGAHDEVMAAERRVASAKKAQDDAMLARQQHAEEVKSKRVQRAAKLAAQQEAERGGSPMEIAEAASGAAKVETARVNHVNSSEARGHSNSLGSILDLAHSVDNDVDILLEN